MRTATGNGAVATLVLLVLAVLTTPAAAANGKRGPSTNPPGQAQFEGRHIDLQRGWGDARTCVVWNEDGETDCFRTEQAADAAIARRKRAETRAAPAAAAWDGVWSTAPWSSGNRAQAVAATPVCSSWLYLYEHVDHAGRSLRFRDVGVTQDLASWGFASQMSSYRIGGCGVTLRDAGWTAYPGRTDAHASSSRMAGGWNDRVRYLRIR